MLQQIEPKFGQQEAQAISEYILNGGWGTEYKYTEQFEEGISHLVGANHCSAVNNGTVGLSLALLASGIKAGDNVIVPALTMIATANAVRFIGAIPVFVDIEEDNLCLDIDKTIELLPNDIQGVIYVSLNGRCGDLIRLKDKCNELGIPLIEDACQSLGSYHEGYALGTIGNIGVYSLSPHKIISTGQGGLIVTNDERLYRKVEELKDFGRLNGGVDHHPEFGINSKFTDFQAIIGLEQLKDINNRIAIKKHIYHLYKQNLKNGEIKEINNETIPWMIDVYGLDKKEGYNNFMTRKMYPVIPNQPVYNDGVDYPVAQKYSDSGIWLPSSVTLTDDEINIICEEINGSYNN